MLIKSLRLENMTFHHDPNQPIFENVSIELPMNHPVWVNGLGGCGKSTLMRLLAGLIFPVRGKYFVGDLDISECSFEEFLPYRLKMGFATDYGGLLSNKSISENVYLPVFYHKMDNPEILAWASLLMEALDLNASANARPAFVTGAVRKAACIARALVLQPEAVFFDNPTESLDRKRRLRLMDVIARGRAAGWLNHVFVAGSDRGFAEKLSCIELSISDRQLFSSESGEVCAI